MSTYNFTHRGRAFSMELHAGNEQMSVHQQKEGGFFEHEMLDYLADHYPDHGVVIDVGANVGNHSLYFSAFLRHSFIISIEPQPRNYALLVGNVSDAWCIPLNVAMAGKPGPVWIATDEYNMGMCHIEPRANRYNAAAVTVDGLGLSNVTLIKIDTEGNELDVLEGARETVQRDRPLIVIEIAVESFDQYDAYMQSIGYDLEHYWRDRIVALYHPRGNR
jgi:FkbM family methyltransferase